MQGIFQKENTDKALKYGIYRHLPTYEKIIRNLVSFSIKKVTSSVKDGETVVISEENLDIPFLKKEIKEIGYELVDVHTEPYEKKGFFHFGKK